MSLDCFVHFCGCWWTRFLAVFVVSDCFRSQLFLYCVRFVRFLVLFACACVMLCCVVCMLWEAGALFLVCVRVCQHTHQYIHPWKTLGYFQVVGWRFRSCFGRCSIMCFLTFHTLFAGSREELQIVSWKVFLMLFHDCFRSQLHVPIL